jgi:hypothetical protein
LQGKLSVGKQPVPKIKSKKKTNHMKAVNGILIYFRQQKNLLATIVKDIIKNKKFNGLQETDFSWECYRRQC